MMDASLIAYVALAALVTVSPGPDMALVLQSVLQSGASGGIRATLGIACGLAIWAVASATGLAALVAASPAAFTALQAAGALYLIYLGVRAIRASGMTVEDGTRVARAPRHFRAGLVTNLLNPKVGMFYLSVLPGFVRPGSTALVTALLLGAIHIVFGLLWLSAYSTLTARAAAMVTRHQVRLFLERATGVILVALGARVIATLPR